MRKHYSEEEKTMWLEDWQTSKKSPWIYAKENGLTPQTFVNWTKQKEKKKSGFVEISKSLSVPPLRNQEILIEKGELKIHIPLEPVLNELPNLIARLGRLI